MRGIKISTSRELFPLFLLILVSLSLIGCDRSAGIPESNQTGSQSVSAAEPTNDKVTDDAESQQRATGATKRDEQPTKRKNTIGQEFARIPGGEFEMGAIPLDEFYEKAAGASLDEQFELLGLTPPKNRVTIADDFWISIHEVTIGQFRQFVEGANYRTDAEQDGGGGTGLLAAARWGQSPQFNWREYGFPVTEQTAVANVSWNDATAFCKWLSEKEGQTYRLPTEAEWEFACRAKTTTTYFTGDLPASLDGYANMADQSLLERTPGLPWALAFDDGHPYLAPVGQFKPNAFGLYDMHGNALEWCADEFSFLDPLKDVTPPPRPQAMYVLRGGNWFNEPLRAGSPCRSGAPPTHRMALIGFRVVLESESEGETKAEK